MQPLDSFGEVNNPVVLPFLHVLKKLKQGGTPYGKAPHKPVFILTLLEAIGKGLFVNNRITVIPEFVALFKENFALLVETPHKPDFFLPFYHLTTDGFWHIKTVSGEPFNGVIKSFSVLQQTVQHAYLDANVWELVTDTYHRATIERFLLNTYFAATQTRFIEAKQQGIGYVQEVQQYILNTAVIAYPISDNDEETRFVRGGLFKKLIPQIYNSTCCISGMRVIANTGTTLIDACHIIPFKTSNNDQVTNGIALTATLHRAFDRGFIGIDTEYRVILSSQLAENEQSPYNLHQFVGKKILLPQGSIHYPSPENLAWHRQNIFLG